MQDEYKAYHTDVQKVIDDLYKMNELLDSGYLKEAMQMLVVQSWQIQMYREEQERRLKMNKES